MTFAHVTANTITALGNPPRPRMGRDPLVGPPRPRHQDRTRLAGSHRDTRPGTR